MKRWSMWEYASDLKKFSIVTNCHFFLFLYLPAIILCLSNTAFSCSIRIKFNQHFHQTKVKHWLMLSERFCATVKKTSSPRLWHYLFAGDSAETEEIEQEMFPTYHLWFTPNMHLHTHDMSLAGCVTHAEFEGWLQFSLQRDFSFPPPAPLSPVEPW